MNFQSHFNQYIVWAVIYPNTKMNCGKTIINTQPPKHVILSLWCLLVECPLIIIHTHLKCFFSEKTSLRAGPSCMRAHSLSIVWLCDPTDSSPPGSSVHGISQASYRRVGCHFLHQGVFPTQRLNLHLLLGR